MSKTIIDIDDVSFSYNNLLVLENISLKINKGEFIGIIGPNASGKSTLLKLILGLYKPDRGQIKVLNKSACDHTGDIGYVPQYHTFQRHFPFAAHDVVMTGHIKPKSYFTGYSKEEKQETNSILEILEIDNIAKQQISELSGGQLQRMLIARALVSKPKILILDEPTANIDIKMGKDIFALLKNYDENITIIIVSHDIAFISVYVDRVACLNKKLVCHTTDSIDGETIKKLYTSQIKMINHEHKI